MTNIHVKFQPISKYDNTLNFKITNHTDEPHIIPVIQTLMKKKMQHTNKSYIDTLDRLEPYKLTLTQHNTTSHFDAYDIIHIALQITSDCQHMKNKKIIYSEINESENPYMNYCSLCRESLISITGKKYVNNLHSTIHDPIVICQDCYDTPLPYNEMRV